MESSKCDDGNFILYTLWFEVQMYFEHSELNNVNPKLVNPWKKVSSNCFRVRSIAMKRHTMCSLLVGRPRLFYVCAYVFAPDPSQCSFFKNCESLKLARLSIRNMAKVA